MSSDAALTTAVAQLLADAGVGMWRPDGPAYTAAETGIFYGPLGAAPDRAVGVAVYLGTDDPELGLTVRRVQVRVRGARTDPSDADTLADAVADALHAVRARRGVAFARRESFARLGADTNGRQERTENYTITLDNPEATP